MSEAVFQYDGSIYPGYLRDGNAMQFFAPFARQFCRGRVLDVGCGAWPLEGAEGVDLKHGGDAMQLPAGPWDAIASSHCLEHLADPVAALEHWRGRLRLGGVLALYLPHPDMAYWRPTRCRKHLHSWQPAQMAEILRDLGFINVLHSERDLAWSFGVVGFRPRPGPDYRVPWFEQDEEGNRTWYDKFGSVVRHLPAGEASDA